MDESKYVEGVSGILARIENMGAPRTQREAEIFNIAATTLKLYVDYVKQNKNKDV